MLIFPSPTFKLFVHDTTELYKAIASVTGSSTIIDSSKSPFRILLLRKTKLSFRIFHVLRGLRGVLFSTSKYLPKNLDVGVEGAVVPKNSWYVILRWIWINTLCVLFSIGTRRDLVKYENLLLSVNSVMVKLGVSEPAFLTTCSNGGPFFPKHIIAGGRIRMSEKVFIDSTLTVKEKWRGRGIKEYLVRIIECLTS
jgi:hypothetical protein